MVDPVKIQESVSMQPFEDAVEDAQFLMAYAAGKCQKDIDEATLVTLINAQRSLNKPQRIDPKLEAEFWLAYQKLWKLVRPVTAESVKANLPMEPRFLSKILAHVKPVPAWIDNNIPGLFQWAITRRTSKARRTADRFIVFTVLILIIVLVLQIYWVIGNQLTAQLAELLQNETQLSQEISANYDEYNAIEMRFKQDEWVSESFKTNGVYTFYVSPDWERDTMDNLSTRAKLETDLASLKSQLERNSAVLLLWSNPWKRLIEKSVKGTNLEGLDQYASQIESIDRQIKELNDQLQDDPHGSKKIQEARNQVDNLQQQLIVLEKNQDANSDQLLSLRSTLDNLTTWINQPGLADQIISQLNQDIERLKEERIALERQQQGDINRETSRQAQLAAQFVLVILQSYLLPLLYGILGAGTFVLRTLSKEIENVTFADGKGTQHVLRVSLGALAGILVGWFSILIPDETTTFIGSISPLAIAFLVGYNIELFFSLMDRALFSITDRLQRPSLSKEEELSRTSSETSASSTQQKNSATEAPAIG